MSWQLAALFKREQNQKMSLKEVTRAGESGGRKTAVRQEQLPSQLPLPKPTRDVSASNRSHSLTHEDPPVFPSHRRILLVDREAEQAQLEKQANVVYTRQFRALAKLLGNESMDFEELREKVEGLVLADHNTHDQQLLQRIRTLQWELSRKNTEARSSQSLPASQEYLRNLETQLGRKNKIITELSDSVKRQAFEEMMKDFQAEVEAKNAALKQAQEQNQQLRLRINTKVSTLQEQLIRHKQTIQKLTFQLDSQKRRAQTANEDVQRLKKREKDLLNSFENEGKAIYQGLSYSSHALLMQLQARDQQLSTSLTQQNMLQLQINSLRRQQLQIEEQYRHLQLEGQTLQAKLQFQQGQKQRFLEEIQQVTKQLRVSKQAVVSANIAQQQLLSEKDRVERDLRQAANHIQQMETKMAQNQLEIINLRSQMTQIEEETNILRIHVQKTKALQQRNQQLQKQLEQLNSTMYDHKEKVQLKQRDLQQLRNEIVVREEEHTKRQEKLLLQITHITHRYEQQISLLRTTMAIHERMNKQSAIQHVSLSTKNTQLEDELQSLKQTLSRQTFLMEQKEKQILKLDQRIQAFEQEKEILMHRLDTAEQEQARMAQRQRHLEEMTRNRPALEAQLNTRQIQEQNLKILLEQAAAKQAQLQAQIEQKEMQLRQIQQERKREQAQYQKQVNELGRLLEQSQEQLQHQKQIYEAIFQEQNHFREESQHQTKQLRINLGQVQERHKQQMKNLMQHLEKVQLQHRQIFRQYQQKKIQSQELVQNNEQLRVYNQQLTTVIQQHSSQILAREEREVQIEKHFHAELQHYQTQINQLKYFIQELKTEKAELQRQLESMHHNKPKDNQLSSFTFNHYEAEHQVAHSSPDLNAIIHELQQKLDSYKRDEEQRIRLSYSNTLQASPALFASLASEKEQLQSQNRRLEQQLIMQHDQFSQKEAQLVEIHKDLQSLRTRLVDYEQTLQQYQATIDKLNNQKDTLRQREEQHIKLREKYDEQIGRVQKQEIELISIRLQLQRMRQARQVHSVAAQLQRTKSELGKATQQIIKLRDEITSTFKQLQMARQQVEFQRRQANHSKLRAEQCEMKIIEYQHRVSELEQRRIRQGSQQPHRMVSGISKRSNVSQQQLEERRSKGSSDGELSRRILNDPSKISGQSSKFAHHLLVLENSKIHVTRQPAAEIAAERQIKQQRQEESVLSKQQQQNKTPESSHRNTLTHFDRISNDNTQKNPRQSQHNFRESKSSQHQSMRQSNHSLNSIRQAEEVQQGAQPSSVSSIQKQIQKKPKEYLPQHSSKKTISNNGSKQNIENRNQSRRSVNHSQQKQSISNNQQRQEISNNQSKQSILPEDAPAQPISFHRNSYQNNVPIYIARPSPLQPQQPRQSSQSQSGSKTKVRISYGKPTDKSIQIQKREAPRQMANSQVSGVSLQNNKITQNSIDHVSPINERASNSRYNSPSVYSSQHKEPRQQRPSLDNNSQIEPPGDSIINSINQMASRTNLTPRISNATEIPRHYILRRQSSPVYIQPRIQIAHSPRHSNFITFNPTRSINPLPTPQQSKLQPTIRQQHKKEEPTVPPSKIVMRSVIGGKRNSLLNDTATFGKNSQKGQLNQTVSQSNDSGIDVLQMDWMAPCCKNN